MGIICLYVLIQKSGQKIAKSHLCAMANPDGYEYSRNYDRSWRKNCNTKNCYCYNFWEGCGVDLNRNWGYNWGTGVNGIHSSNEPCHYEKYHGTGPFSEPETENIKEYLEGKDF